MKPAMTFSFILLFANLAFAQSNLCDARWWTTARGPSAQAAIRSGQSPTLPCPNNVEGDYPLHLAAVLANDAGAVQALINAGAGALTPNAAGETPIALFTSRYEQTVLNFGQAGPVLTAMAEAFNLQFEAVGAAQNNLCSISWLQSATIASMEAVVQTQGVNLNPDCDGAGNTPLHFALSMRQIYSKDNYFAIATLIQAGANVNTVNGRGQTPLDLAENRYQRMLDQMG